MYPLADPLDHEILMHRDAHFGGKFSAMLDYYEKGGKGSQPDFEISRIGELALAERDIGQDISPMILSDLEKEKVQESKKIYELLNKVREGSGIATLISHLILSEEEHPEDAIKALVSQKEKALDPLIELLRTEHFHDPLFPGYALAPQLAAEALGQIGHKKAIITLFESIAEGDFFDDEASILALSAIGEPARDFLLKVIQKKPFTLDNDRAAMALVAFKGDPAVAKTCFNLLKDVDFLKEEAFASYLILSCEGLKNTHEAQEFIEFARSTLPKSLSHDAEIIIKSF